MVKKKKKRNASVSYMFYQPPPFPAGTCDVGNATSSRREEKRRKEKERSQR